MTQNPRAPKLHVELSGSEPQKNGWKADADRAVQLQGRRDEVPRSALRQRCRRAKVIPWRGSIVASAGNHGVSAMTAQRTMPAAAAGIAAWAGLSRSGRERPINTNTTTSTATNRDHSSPARPASFPAALQRSCTAWLPRINAAIGRTAEVGQPQKRANPGSLLACRAVWTGISSRQQRRYAQRSQCRCREQSGIEPHGCGDPE